MNAGWWELIAIAVLGAVVWAVGRAVNRGQSRLDRMLARARLEEAMGRVQPEDSSDEEGAP